MSNPLKVQLTMTICAAYPIPSPHQCETPTLRRGIAALCLVLLAMGWSGCAAPESRAPVLTTPAVAVTHQQAPARSEVAPEKAPLTVTIPGTPRLTQVVGPPPDADSAFRDWLAEHRVGAADLATGIALAKDRRAALHQLIKTDPKEALTKRVRWRDRQNLPAPVAAELETPIADTATLVRAAQIGDPDLPATFINAELSSGGGYISHTWGRRAGMYSKQPVNVWGIGIDGDAAFSDRPTRQLDPGEPVDPAAAVVGPCQVSRLPSDPALGMVVAKRVHYVCSKGHIAALDAELAGREVLSAAPPGAPAGWTMGTKTLLYFVVRLSGQSSGYPTLAEAQDQISQVNERLRVYSFGKFQGFIPTFVEVTIPATNPSWGVVSSQAQAEAVAQGYSPYAFDFRVYRYNGGRDNFGGLAAGYQDSWLRQGHVGTAVHEFGHNFGLGHANFWNASDDSITGPGVSEDYGNPFDTMGASQSGGHYNAGSKHRLTWLTDRDFHQVTTSGTYRITAQDNPDIVGSIPQAIRVNIAWPSIRDRANFPTTFPFNYWIEYRQQFTGNQWLRNGVTVKANGSYDDLLFDTTPGSADGKDDSAVTFGRTFSDRRMDLHITPLGFTGTVPQSIDVRINLGTQDADQAPVISTLTGPTTLAVNVNATFTVNAQDPDGDELSYFWSFGTNRLVDNSASTTASWGSPGTYPVRVVASDMKGRTTAQTLLVTVGTPTTFTVRGTVRDDSGQPVADVRVHNGASGGSYRGSFTDQDGTFTITNLAAGTVTLSAVKTNWNTFTTQFTNPIALTGSVSGRDFTGSSKPIVTVVATDPIASESTSDTGTWRFTRTGEITAPLTIVYARNEYRSQYTLNPEPAISPTNLVIANLITIPAGSSSTNLVLTATPDAVAEGHQDIVLTLLPDPDYAIGSENQETIRILGTPGPANDAFAQRIVLSGRAVTTTANNQFATREPGEPFHWNSSELASLWWTWTAPSSGTTVITLAGSSFDTVMAVYTGTALTNLNQIAHDDDSADGTVSRVSFAAASGVTYHIAVAGYGVDLDSGSVVGSLGTIALALNHTPGGVDAAPTIAAIADQTTNEDAAISVGVSVADEDTPLASLTVTASSSDTDLFPAGSLAIGGNAAARTVAATPAANHSGLATITVTVSDGNSTASRAFLLTVAAVNDPPAIAPIANTSLTLGATSGAIAVTVSDIDTPVASLVVTAISGTTSVVTAAGVTLGGGGGSRTISIATTGGQVGSSVITVQVSDGSLTTATTFTVTVTSATGLPIITTNPANVTMRVGRTATFTVAATDTPAPTFQWQSSPDGSTWTAISGATAASYTTATLTLTDNDARFRAVATNGGGSATSTAATLTVRRRGDVNLDGTVDISDLILVKQAFGGTTAMSDLNGDGAVDISDLILVKQEFGL